MRSIITFVLVCITSIVSYADYRPASITVSSAINHRLVVVVDNDIHQSNDNYISVSNLSPGIRHIKVYRLIGRHNGRLRPRDIRNADLLYSTSLQLKPMTNVEIYINRLGQANVREQFNSRRNNRNRDWDDRYANDSRNRRHEDYDDRYGRNDRYDRDDRYDRTDRAYDRSPVAFNRFTVMLAELKRENFENSRVRLAKQMLSSEYFSSKQVEAILSEFAVEQNKL